VKIRSARRSHEPRIEIIPLIDIMFFLLATFVMVSTAMIQNKGLSMNLPVSQTATAQPRQDYVTVTVTETGEYFLDRTASPKDSLAEALRARKASSPELQVFINGDKSARIEALIGALDEVKKAGITKVGIETRTTEPRE
jgi:biopolymer transport protein ExbD